MSSQPEMGLINQLFRELGQIATVPTKREVSLHMRLESVYTLVKEHLLPGEAPVDGVRRLIQAGIEAEKGKLEEARRDQKVKEAWSRANCLPIGNL